MEDLVSMDRRTRKILAMNGCMHARSNVARLYLSRKAGGKGLISVEECVKKETKSPYDYAKLRNKELNDTSCTEGEGVVGRGKC